MTYKVHLVIKFVCIVKWLLWQHVSLQVVVKFHVLYMV